MEEAFSKERPWRVRNLNKTKKILRNSFTPRLEVIKYKLNYVSFVAL